MGLLGAGIIGTAIGIKFNKKIEETYAIAALMLTFVVYFPALFFSFTPGIVLAMLIIGVSAFYLFFKLIKDRRTVRNTIFTWGGLALFSFFCFFVYYSYHRDFNHPDEFYCWGMRVRDFYNYNVLFSEYSTAASGEQPLLLPIWNFINAKLFVRYEDSICYLAQDVLVVSMLVPIFAYTKRKITAAKFFALSGCLPLIMVLSGMEGFDYVLVDGAIAAVMCIFVLNVISFFESDDRYYYVASIIALSAIILTKRVGPVFAGLILFCVTSSFLRKKKYVELVGYTLASSIVSFAWFGIGLEFSNVKLALLMSVIPFAGIIGGVLLFVVLKSLMRVSAEHRDVIIIVLVFGVFSIMLLGSLKYMGVDGYAYGVLARFCNDFIQITVEKGFIKLSYGIYMILDVVLAAYLFAKKKDVIIRDISFFIIFAMTAYAIVMLYLHIFSIGPLNNYIEGLVPRYMIPWEILVVFLYFYEFIINDTKLTFVKCLVAFIIIALVSNTGGFFRGLFFKHQSQHYNEFDRAGIELHTGNMIYYVDEEANYGYADREFYYHMAPARTNFMYYLFEGTISEPIETPIEEFKEELIEGYDYLYLQTCTERFVERYADLFGGEDKVIQGSAYYVVPDSGDGVILKRIERQ